MIVAFTWVLTTILGGVIYLVARRWYRRRLDTMPLVVEPDPWTVLVEAPEPAAPLAQGPEGQHPSTG